jgi:hypothetical protein
MRLFRRKAMIQDDVLLAMQKVEGSNPFSRSL